jgi:glycine/D-amino acid oxidase-like deaminating enzyme/nitrite reductase/ring-hydroxylating ferredoxin subunit
MTDTRHPHRIEHLSAWQATAALPEFPPLAGDERVDVAIVGAGIAGMTTAYLLARAGKRVAVLDDGPIADGMTAVTTAHLTAVIDDRFVEMERLHGEGGSRLAAQSHSAAIDRIEAIVAAERIDCAFERVDGWLFQPPGADPALLDRELDAARRAGMRVEQAARAPFEGFDTGPCLRFAAQAQFHPLRYLDGLARAIVRDGGRIHNGTHVDDIAGGANARVVAKGGTVAADAVVVATNTPVNNRVAVHTKQAPYMTYVIAAGIPAGALPRALYWDTADPYHYVRLCTMPDGRELLIVGGEDHKTGQAADTAQRHARLEQWARERFPRMQQVEFRWAGQVMETIDGLAFIGRNPLDKDNVYVVTGDSGMGMTHGTIAGILVSDLILGRANPWATLYDPARKTLRAAKEFTREALNMAAQYTDWLKPGDAPSVDAIAPGTGAMLQHGLSKQAVYRDDGGALHRFSAVCPHLGCIVHWNASEHTFDCPCHGSRFDALGKVISGPANRDLTPLRDA